jgi:hypothetical protein
MKRNFDRRQSLLEDDQLSRALRKLPARKPPAALATSLRVLASQERQRTHRSLSEAFSAWTVRTRLWIDNLMRPLAVPFAGGVLSAVALFGIWLVPTYPQPHATKNFDIPTILTTDPTVKRLNSEGLSSSDVIVIDVFVDDSGHMIDYKVVSGVLTDAALRRRLENILVFTDFVPATEFGRPRAGRTRLSVVSSSIIVKG